MEQLAEPPDPVRTQLVAGEKLPRLPLIMTLPEGVRAIPPELSVTVTVQVLGALTGSGFGVQVRLVRVERCVAVRLKLLELPE